MNKKTFVEKRKGWPGLVVDYTATSKDGTTYKGTMGEEEWEAYKIQDQLIKAGADESLVEALYDMGYSIGYDNATRDAGEDASL